MDLRDRLITLSVMKNGNWFKMYEVLTQDIQLKQITDRQVKEALEKLRTTQTLTILDEDYPKSLKEMQQPPFVLYYQGDLALLKKKKIGVMGNRRPSVYGIKSCQSIIGELASAAVVVGGNLQLGIAASAHLLSVRKNNRYFILWFFTCLSK